MEHHRQKGKNSPLFHHPSLYVPNADVRLLSTNHLLQLYEGETIEQTHNGLRLSGIDDDPSRNPVQVEIDLTSNLPSSQGYHNRGINHAAYSLSNTITQVDRANMNLSEPEKEWMRWHCRFGHISFRTIQFLMRTGLLSHSEETKRLHTAFCKLSSPSMCAACQYGRQRRRYAPGQKTTTVKDRVAVIKTDNLLPGQCISADHFHNSVKGRLFTSKGKTADHPMYCGRCIFVDHASGYVDVCSF